MESGLQTASDRPRTYGRVICRSRGGWCSGISPSGIPIVDKGLPNVPGLLFFCSHVQADCFCPAMQCLHHHKFVGHWVVGHKVEVVVCVGCFLYTVVRMEPSGSHWRRASRKGSLPSDSNSTVNCMLGSTPLRWSKNCCTLEAGSTASHSLFCTSTDEDNRMVVETFDNYQPVLARALVAFRFVAYLSFDPTLFGLGLAAYLALEIALCSALLLAASWLPVEPVVSLCSLADTSFLGHRRRPYIVFRNRCLYGFMFVYNNVCIIIIYISVKMAAPWGSSTLLNFHSLCLHLRSHLTKWEVFQNTSS